MIASLRPSIGHLLLAAVLANVMPASVAAEPQGIILTMPRNTCASNRAYCTPAERAERDRQDAEKARAKAEFDAAVDAQAARMGGDHRRAEAEAYVRMQQAAAAAQPKPQEPAQPKPRRNCTTERYKTTAASWNAEDEADAMAQVIRNAERTCRQRSGNPLEGRPGGPGFTMGPKKCEKKDVSLWAQMKGMRPRQRPKDDPPRIIVDCHAEITCTIPMDRCESSGPAAATAQ
ncbi:hypothetical protein D3870_21720 [Noviherbaspirillum cavernae]|uniref:DUF4124 domain-containing protein n=1 Tax=Noviherbaspirillum cavernae TaxID=2320862 RepID=A0A418WWA2_9BURK|nr:hypothetical protein [Noviherbaspirillum cavernae]RJF96975.1 hypothetical protein D3870_21720 [Noviherbaspirillum cavernae]